jgi:hypothetical protein
MNGVLSYGALWRPAENGTAMRTINPIQFYRLGAIARLRDLTPHARVENLRMVAQAEVFLTPFWLEDFYQQIAPTASERASYVFDTVKQYVDPHGDFHEDGLQNIERELLRFETSLEDDLSRLPTYIVEGIAAYSVRDLISSAERVFSPKICGILTEQVLVDIKAAGACLAFDLPTACGFHVFRATDAMLRQYCSHFNGVLKGNARDWENISLR